jgi:hypothetical protein
MTSPDPCVPNIGPQQRLRRVRFGSVSLLVGVVSIAVLAVLGVPRAWRLVAFLPLWAGALGIFQAHERTCIALVAQGKRDMDGGPEAVTDPTELERLKRQALGVHLRSLLAAAVVSGLSLAIP